MRWLDGPGRPRDGVIDRYGAHRRFSAVAQPGVTLLDDYDLPSFDDQRTTYLSAFDDEILTIVEWSRDPLVTLVRIVNTLLRDKALGGILTLERIGDDLEDVVDSDRDTSLIEALHKGLQLGWLKEDDAQYDDWRDRWQSVANRLLERLGPTDGDTDARTEMFKDAHGFLAATTLLYKSLGLDIQIHVQIPDTNYVRRDGCSDLLRFVQHTVPKQACYQIHSAWRNLVEDREDKLKSRFDVNVDPTDPQADLAVDWVFAGPGISDFAPDIRTVLDELQEDGVREQVRNGDEDMFALEIAVHETSSTAGIQQVIQEYCSSKGFVDDGYRDIAMICQSMLRGQDHRASAYDVSETMLHLEASSGYAQLSVDDIEYALGQLHWSRLCPELPESMQKVLSALLTANEPLSPSELREEAGISQRSWERHWSGLTVLGFVSETDDHCFDILLTPTWSPLWWSPTDEPIPNSGGPVTPAEAVATIVEDCEQPISIQEGEVDHMLSYPDSSAPPDWRVATALSVTFPHFEEFPEESAVASSVIGNRNMMSMSTQKMIA